MSTALFYSGAGTGFTFLMTVMGAAVVFFFRKSLAVGSQKVFFGFAAGVMIAASIWSLLIPAIEEAQAQNLIAWIPAAGGFVLGMLFIYLLDRIIPIKLSLADNSSDNTSDSAKRTSLLVLAITLHNIPEGMAVGLAFALAAQNGGTTADFAPAIALALGIGIQNFPEGAAVSLPLHQDGMSLNKSFLTGSISGVVEPIFGIFTVLISSIISPYMPWLLSFAAGAMMYVVVEELIPEAHFGECSQKGTISVMAGFLIMMILDVALG